MFRNWSYILLFLCCACLCAQSKPMSNAINGLDQSERKALIELLEQGKCPCDNSQSIWSCAKANTCPAASELAQFGALKFREGLSSIEVQQAVIKKYLNDHVRYEFDVSDSPIKGEPSAPIKVIEFADFQCGHCARMSETVEQLSKEFTNKVVFIFKQFPLSNHPHAHYAARASIAAHRQNRFWDFQSLLFRHQLELSETRIDGFAKQLGLNLDKYRQDREAPATYARIEKDRAEGIAAGLRSTPTLYINGQRYSESKSIETLRAHIDKLSQQKNETKR